GPDSISCPTGTFAGVDGVDKIPSFSASSFFSLFLPDRGSRICLFFIYTIYTRHGSRSVSRHGRRRERGVDTWTFIYTSDLFIYTIYTDSRRSNLLLHLKRSSDWLHLLHFSSLIFL
ncbi:MAG: hypothetical protein J2P37_30980, partial [Ktedonobacteraceae bacterium]|nr:hypothetical protein [Ktedonobacteraceae bacterium]